MQTDEILELLKRVAEEVITPRFRALSDSQIKEKRPGDLVTVADHEAEVLITRALCCRAYPDGGRSWAKKRIPADPCLMQRFQRLRSMPSPSTLLMAPRTSSTTPQIMR
ncbi:MAG: hypothetical protein V9G13_12030 [Marmoricola sp.]